MALAIKIEAMQGIRYARIAKVIAPSGASVVEGDLLLEIENHKVVQEMESFGSGQVLHSLQAGDIVRVDTPIAYIATPQDKHEALFESLKDAKATLDEFWGEQVCPVPSDKFRPVSVAKAAEIAVLGSDKALQATLGAAIGPIKRRPDTSNFFADKVTDLVIYEASRLLATKKHRVLNARFEAGAIVTRDEVRCGLSYDDGGRLTLYTIPHTDKLSLPDTQDAIVEGLMRYVGRKLTLEDVATSTFTVSDLTTSDLWISVPLLPRDQCIIIAVIKDSTDGYLLSITYDHRITEGLAVAKFASELVARVRSYSIPDTPVAPVCSFCHSPAHSEVNDFKRKGLLKIIDATGAEVLSCITCWENW
jgi:pyruvate/2-oxoglutarate dehydrogenase complex dihydrolipoamide acyltransferase (E2) component